MDAGARGRRLLQRREYRAKVSDFIPKELEDQFSYNKNGELVFELDLKKAASNLKTGIKNWWNKPIMKPNVTKDQQLQKIRNQGGDPSHWANSFEPEGEMIEANSAQMKAMHDAQMKKKEDDKVAAKKKDVKEGSAYGITRGSGKPSGAFKDYLDKKKKEKKKVEEGKEEGGYISNAAKAEVRNQRRFGKKGSAEPTGRFGQGTSEKAKLALKRGEEHKARRGVKTKKEEVQLEAKKSCGEGEYYCYDMKKCKPIPEGMKVGKDGMLVKEQQLIEYSPNVSYQAKGGKKSGKLGKSSVYSLRGKKESKKDFRKSHTKDIKDGLVEDMKGMSQKSGDKRSTESGAGMTAKGVAKYNRRTGGNLKTAVTTPPSKLKAGSKAANRRKSFCARSKSWDGPRGKAARRRWNCSYEPELPMIIDEKKKLFNSAPLSDRVAAWSKKITEGDVYVKSNRNRLTGLPNLGKGDKKSVEKKITGVNYGAMAQSYVPQGDMVEMATFNLDDLEKSSKKYYDLTNPRERAAYSRLKKAGKNPLIKKVDEGALTTGAALTAAGLAAWKFAQGMNARNKMKKSIETPGTNLNRIKNATDQKNQLLQQLNQSHEPEGEMTEAKVDKGKSDYAKQNERNQRTFGNRRGSRGSLASHDDTEARRYNTKKGRGVKMKGKKDKTPVNYHKKDSQARVDALLKSMKEDFYRKKYDVKDGGYKKTNKMTKSNKRAGDSKAQNREVHLDLRKYKLKKLKTEGSLHKWFKGSKSKDGKPGWVNVVTGGTCASDKKGEGTPKCVSSSKRASMTKAERLSASRRKKKADPGQQSKSGAAKPTYVATDKKKKVDEMNQGPSTPVGNYDGKIMPKFGAGRIGNVRLKGGKTLADLVKGV